MRPANDGSALAGIDRQSLPSILGVGAFPRAIRIEARSGTGAATVVQ